MDNTNMLKPNGNIISSDSDRAPSRSDSDRIFVQRPSENGRVNDIADDNSGTHNRTDTDDNTDVPYNTSDEQVMGESLAMVYSPKQYFADIYTEDEALGKGTLFKKLYKPLEAAEGDER